MKPTLRIGIFALVALAAMGAITWIWLLHTSSGANFAWSQIQARVNGELVATRIEGDLSSGVSIAELRFSSEKIRFLAEQLDVAIDFNLFPLSLTIESAVISGVDIQMESEVSDTNTSEIQWEELLTAIRLPVDVYAKELRVDDISIVATEDRYTQMITSLSLTGSLMDRLVVDQLLVDTPLGSLSADLSLELSAPHALQLNATANVIDRRPEGGGEIDVTTTVEGNSNILELEVSSRQLQVNVAGSVAGVLNDPVFDLVIRTLGSVQPLQLGDSSLDVSELTANLTGTSKSFAVDADAQVEIENSGAIDVTMEGSGTPQQLLISELQLQGDRIAATASGSFEWGPSLAASATGVIDRFDLHELVEPWPAGFPVSGAFEFDWQDQKIQLRQLELAIETAGTEISGVGEIDTLEGIVDGSLRWAGLRWPLNSEVAALTSNEGELKVAGKPTDWTVDGRLALQPADLPAGSVVVKGSGNLDSVAVNVIDSQVFGGSIGGRTEFNWRDNKPFSAQLDFSEVRVDWLWPDWPGDVAGSFELGGTLEPFSIDIDVPDMNGSLRQQSVHGAGGLSIATGNVEFRQLDVEHGVSALSLDGNIHSPSGVDFEFVLDDVQSYVENAMGHAMGKGNLSLNVDNPRIQINATAEDLTYADIHVDSITAVDESANGDNPFDQRVTVSGLQFGDNIVDELAVAASGSLVDHDLTIDLKAEYGTIALGASGALTDFQDTKLSTWRGTLAAFDVDITETLRASLDKPSSLLVSPGETRLESACLSSVNGEQVCLGLSWTEQHGADVDARLTDISMDIPMAMASSDIELTQKVSGDIRLGRNSQGLVDGIASLQISPGQVRSRSDAVISTDTDAGAMGFEIKSGNLDAGYFDLPMPGLGVIDIDFSIDELGRGADSNLSGRAVIDLIDIGVLANFLPYVDGTSGRLKTNIAVTGAVSDPTVTGELTLSDAAIENSQVGTVFTDINIESTMHENSRLDLSGTFRAGNGVGAIKSSITYDDIATRGLEFEISGNDLTLIEMPDLSIVANPDLQVGLSDGTLQVGGVLAIPEAMIRPGFNQNLRISESEDVVIVAGELQGQEPDAGAGQGLKIDGDLRVVLGSNVQVDLGVAEAKLAGSVDFEWQGDPIPIASGAYTIDGTIAAVGQVLTISQGTIRFSSVPANNPNLNIRAEREIFGNSQIRTAGVMLSGNAQNPVMEAYTSPATNEERALALLATGSDFDYEEGVGAIDFGTYVAPKLFLSYGIGVFDRENVISARYDLKKGFGIKATSGKRESGLDVNYRFEN